MHRSRWVGLLLLVALVATACGGRMSESEIASELATDGGDATGGQGRTGGSGDGGTAADGSGADGSAGVEGAGAADGGGTAGGTDGSGSTSGEQAAPAPAGGNGGATDVGVTPTQISVGNVATLSGPVPGLFRGALVGTQAFFAYQNSKGGLYGRQFKVISGDDNFDTGKNRSAHKAIKDQVFAFVGSFSLFDGASASEIESSKVLDVGRALQIQRQNASTHISPMPFGIGWPTTGCAFLKQRFGPDVIKKMAIFWGNADAARTNAEWQRQTCEAEGFDFIYEREVQATETNFTGDVIEMKRRGVQGVFMVFDVTGIARFFKSLRQQGFDPPLKYPSAASYDSAFITLAGDAAEGIIIGQNLVMYLGQDAAQVPEIALFKEWMAKVDPNQKLDIFALYGWMSGRLMLHAMEKVGPKVTRAAVLAELQKIHEWNNLGLSDTVDVGAKKPGRCEMYIEVKGGEFRRLSPAQGFNCNGTFRPFAG
jgi:ABC-type branched-subunit amino acid transport system substrate-binding protein